MESGEQGDEQVMAHLIQLARGTSNLPLPQVCLDTPELPGLGTLGKGLCKNRL